MTPNDFLGQLSKLPPNTPITAEHLISILSILSKDTQEATSTIQNEYSHWDREKLIDEKTLANWLNKNVKTIQDWRWKGKGPKFIKDEGGVNYRVGTVIDWIHSREVKSTTQADTLKFGGYEFDSVFPSILINDIAFPFFETIKEDETDYDEMNITGYELLWTENNSLSSIYLSNLELEIDSQLLIKQFSDLKANGTDLNAPQTILMNGDIKTINLSHLIAAKPYKDEVLGGLIIELSELGLDFKAHNSNGLTSLEIAKNLLFNRVIDSINLHNELKTETKPGAKLWGKV